MLRVRHDQAPFTYLVIAPFKLNVSGCHALNIRPASYISSMATKVYTVYPMSVVGGLILALSGVCVGARSKTQKLTKSTSGPQKGRTALASNMFHKLDLRYWIQRPEVCAALQIFSGSADGSVRMWSPEEKEVNEHFCKSFVQSVQIITYQEKQTLDATC